MAEWAQTIITAVTGLASGAFGKAVIDSWVGGRRQRKHALGERESERDRVLASRLVWLNDSLRNRGIVYRRAADEAFPLPDDPMCPPPRTEDP